VIPLDADDPCCQVFHDGRMHSTEDEVTGA
jgi:hypothetical protein